MVQEKFVQGFDVKPTSKWLGMWNNSELAPLGTTRVITTNPRKNKRYSIEFVVVRENLVPIIGARAASSWTLSPFTALSLLHRPQALRDIFTNRECLVRYRANHFLVWTTQSGDVHVEVDADVHPVITPPGESSQLFNPNLRKSWSITLTRRHHTCHPTFAIGHNVGSQLRILGKSVLALILARLTCTDESNSRWLFLMRFYQNFLRQRCSLQ